MLRGVEGVVFLNRVVESAQRGSLWIEMPPPPTLETIAATSVSAPTVNSRRGAQG